VFVLLPNWKIFTASNYNFEKKNIVNTSKALLLYDNNLFKCLGGTMLQKEAKTALRQGCAQDVASANVKDIDFQLTQFKVCKCNTRLSKE